MLWWIKDVCSLSWRLHPLRDWPSPSPLTAGLVPGLFREQKATEVMLQLAPALQYLGLFWDAYSTPQRGEVPRGEGQGSAPPLPRRCLQLQPPFQSHQMTPLEGSN